MDPESLQPYVPYLVGFSVLWIVGWVLASVFYRLSQGKPILPSGVENAIYIERFASGCSHKAWYTKLGGASRCLVVAIANGRLIVRPMFPFNLMFLPEIYGLEYEIPIEHVSRIEETAGLRRGTLIEFRDGNGQLQQMTLLLKRPDEFARHIPMRPERNDANETLGV